VTTARLVLFAALLASPLHADSAKGVSVWPGVAAAVIPAAADCGASLWAHSKGLSELNGGGSANLTCALKVGVVYAQADWDYRQRQAHGGRTPRKVWIVRGASAALQFGLAAVAYHKGRAR
jgi:hypothetical protein